MGNKEKNVLILSVGRRVELVNCFKNAAKKLGIVSQIIGADCSHTAPALYFSDKICTLPKISDPTYIDAIINVSNKENISLIVPTIDTDLLLLSKNKDYIESNSPAKIMISNEKVVEICRDKINTQVFLENNGFGTPHLYTENEVENNEIQYPAFIKPKDGSSSINAFKITTVNELNTYKNMIKNPIIQSFVEGDEYTVDVFLDFDANVIVATPRLRLATRSGEISKGKIIKDKDIIADVIRMMEILKPIGHITVQCMKTAEGIKYIEINPRFGGGAPMSIQSGADSCEYLYRLLCGERLTYNENYKDNLMFLRFDNSICLNEDMEVVLNG